MCYVRSRRNASPPHIGAFCQPSAHSAVVVFPALEHFMLYAWRDHRRISWIARKSHTHGCLRLPAALRSSARRRKLLATAGRAGAFWPSSSAYQVAASATPCSFLTRQYLLRQFDNYSMRHALAAAYASSAYVGRRNTGRPRRGHCATMRGDGHDARDTCS